MADEPDEFDEIMDSRGLEWLKKHLPELLKGLAPEPPKPGTTMPASSENPFRDLWEASRKETEKLRERLEEMADVLTPEQRQLIRSKLQKSGAGDPPAPAPAPAPSPEDPKPPEQAPKKSLFRKL